MTILQHLLYRQKNGKLGVWFLIHLPCVPKISSKKHVWANTITELSGCTTWKSTKHVALMKIQCGKLRQLTKSKIVASCPSSPTSAWQGWFSTKPEGCQVLRWRTFLHFSTSSRCGLWRSPTVPPRRSPATASSTHGKQSMTGWMPSYPYNDHRFHIAISMRKSHTLETQFQRENYRFSRSKEKKFKANWSRFVNPGRCRFSSPKMSVWTTFDIQIIMRLLQERMNPRVSLFQCHTFLSTPLLHFCSSLSSSFFPVFLFGGVSFQKMRHCFGALVMTEGELHLFSEAGPRPGGGTTSESDCDGRGRGGFHLSMPPKMKSGTAWSGHSLRKRKIQVEKVWKRDETLKFRWKLDVNFMLIRVFSTNFSWFDFPRFFCVNLVLRNWLLWLKMCYTVTPDCLRPKGFRFETMHATVILIFSHPKICNHEHQKHHESIWFNENYWGDLLWNLLWRSFKPSLLHLPGNKHR